MKPEPEEDQVLGLIKQVREQEATIKQLRARILQLEEVEGMNRELVKINEKLAQMNKDLLT
jgi:hypothetical protein